MNCRAQEGSRRRTGRGGVREGRWECGEVGEGPIRSLSQKQFGQRISLCLVFQLCHRLVRLPMVFLEGWMSH